MKVFNVLTLLALLFLAGSLSAQGTPVPATEEETSETTDVTIEDLVTEEENAPMVAKPVVNDQPSAKSGSMFEFGVAPAYLWLGSDVNAKGGYGGGFHVRKGLDGIFSLRLDGLYGRLSGDNESGSTATNRRYEMKYTSGTGLVLITLNNFKFDGGIRKTNFYVMAGAGAHNFETAYQLNDDDNGIEGGQTFDEDDPFDSSRNGQVESEVSAHAAAGAGVAFRLSERVNIGLEFQTHIPFGDQADLLDGYDQAENNESNDVLRFANLNLNFNIGNSAKKTEPTYWENPFNPVRSELDRIDSRVNAATVDSDGDGVVDAVDQDNNTPAGVPVDTRGTALDSDKDGVPDFRDLEPFFPPRAGEEVDDNGVVMNRADKPITEDRVQEMIDASLERFGRDNAQTTTITTNSGGALYLPMIYFPISQHTIKYSDYGTLSSVARVLEANPGLRLIVRGYTDRTGNAANNQVLSYRRARAVVDHLVDQHGISRSNLIIQYRGEENAIVPLDKSYINRRVEFLPATGSEQEDPAPAGAENGRGGY